MRILIFKLVVTPLLIGGISLLGRRWGPTVGGLLVGLPLTSGPVALFLALDHGARFAASSSLGILAGGLSGGLFCLSYSWLAFRLRWPATLLLSWGAFFASTAALRGVSLALLPTYLGVIIALALIALALPRGREEGAVSTGLVGHPRAHADRDGLRRAAHGIGSRARPAPQRLARALSALRGDSRCVHAARGRSTRDGASAARRRDRHVRVRLVLPCGQYAAYKRGYRAGVHLRVRGHAGDAGGVALALRAARHRSRQPTNSL